METMGARLKRLRENRRLTIQEVSRRLGCAVSTYRDWEYGRKIQGEPYLALAEILSVSVRELLTGEPTRHRNLLKALADVKQELASLEAEIIALDR